MRTEYLGEWTKPSHRENEVLETRIYKMEIKQVVTRGVCNKRSDTTAESFDRRPYTQLIS